MWTTRGVYGAIIRAVKGFWFDKLKLTCDFTDSHLIGTINMILKSFYGVLDLL